VLIHVTSGIDTSGPAEPVQHVNVETLTHFTRQPGRSCDGPTTGGELAIEYENVGDGWTATARRSNDDFGELTPIFLTLEGRVRVTDAGSAVIAGRRVHGLRASPPDSNSPNADVQTLWIDDDTHLPLRWSLTRSHSTSPPVEYGFFIVPDQTIDLRLPQRVQAPACIANGG